jgi:hypothetical protein
LADAMKGKRDGWLTRGLEAFNEAMAEPLTLATWAVFDEEEDLLGYLIADATDVDGRSWHVEWLVLVPDWTGLQGELLSNAAAQLPDGWKLELSRGLNGGEG